MKRLGPYISIELIDGLEEKISPRATEKEIQALLKKETAKIRKLIDKDEILVVLDPQGAACRSEEIARQLESWNVSGKNRLTFLIGAAHGLAEEIKKQAHDHLSLSPLTFPHQMAVLILTEQIYRGFRIIRGEPYHR